MKKLLIGLLVFGSISSFAKVEVLTDPINPYTKEFFSDESNLDGVCISMGFDGGVVADTVSHGRPDYRRVTEVNSGGNIVSTNVTNPRSYSNRVPGYINEIGCEGEGMLKENFIVLEFPQYNEANLNYLANSDEDGVCISKGFLKGAVANSIVSDSVGYSWISDKKVVVGHSGSPVPYSQYREMKKRYSDFSFIRSIACRI